MDLRPVGIILAAAGAIGAALAVLADPVGMGEGFVFGRLQLLGLLAGVIVTVVGARIAEWIPTPRQLAAASRRLTAAWSARPADRAKRADGAVASTEQATGDKPVRPDRPRPNAVRERRAG
jgi:hypothetical protein